MTGFLALVLTAAVVAGGIWLYNGLVGLRNQAGSAWAQIDVQLKRRHDLIPNLVAAVAPRIARLESMGYRRSA